MGLFKKKIVKKTYDREHMKPVIRASICTGEEVAGFKDIRTGKIEEIMLIRSPEDLEKFKEAVYEREQIGETGMGNQIAIPHGLTDQVNKASVAIAKVKNPVEWESLDDQPVRLIFLLAAPTNELEKTHLQMLAQLASVLAYKEHVDALMECETKEQFFQLFESYFDEFTKRKEENK